MGGETRSLGAERILDDLHEHFLSVVYEIGDRRAVAKHRHRLRSRRVRAALAGDRSVAHLLRVRVGDVRHVKKRRAIESDIHEGGLHSGENAAHPALVDVSHEPAPVRALDEDLLEHAALDQRDPGLARGDVDQQLGAHIVLPGRGSGRLRRAADRRRGAARSVPVKPSWPVDAPQSNGACPVLPDGRTARIGLCRQQGGVR